MPDDVKKNNILSRISSIEERITKAQEYLNTGEHAHWHGFRPVFKSKTRDGEVVPPHKDWVKHVFLPNQERALKKAEKLLDKFD